MSGANVSPTGRNKEEWLVQATDYRKWNEPPRPRLQRNGTIYLMALHPSFAKEGTSPFPPVRVSGLPRANQPYPILIVDHPPNIFPSTHRQIRDALRLIRTHRCSLSLAFDNSCATVHVANHSSLLRFERLPRALPARGIEKIGIRIQKHHAFISLDAQILFMPLCLSTPHGVNHALDQQGRRSEEHTSELQSLAYLVCRLLLEKKKTNSAT